MSSRHTTAAAATAAPNPPQLPPHTGRDTFSETQWAVLIALLDAALPSLALESSIEDTMVQASISEAQFQDALQLAQTTMVEPPSEALLKAYLGDRLSSYPDARDGIARLLGNASTVVCKQLRAVLSALS